MVRSSVLMRRRAWACVSRPPRANRRRLASRPGASLSTCATVLMKNNTGTAAVLAAFCVQTGQLTTLVRQRHRSCEFLELLHQLDQDVPRRELIHLILDPVRMHCSAEVALYVAFHPDRFVFHWLPLHASWLSFIEAWFAILSKKCLARSEWCTFADAEQAITAFTATYNAYQAHPFTWRKGVRFYQRLKDKLTASTTPPAPSVAA